MTARGKGLHIAEDPAERARFGLDGLGGDRASLFPHGKQREQRLTSRLLAMLELCLPFAQEFFAHLDIKGPTTARVRTGTSGAYAIVEPTLRGRSRADGAISFRKGGAAPIRCAFEVKYLQTGPGGRIVPAKLTAAQVKATYRAANAWGFDHLITISAAEWDGVHHPSGYVQDGRHARRIGLSHISWSGVMRVLRATRLERAEHLSEAEVRLLLDFERYLKTSEIWDTSRTMSLGSNFTQVRAACAAGRHGSSRAITNDMVTDVASRWVRLTEVVAHTISVLTDHEVDVDRSGRGRTERPRRTTRAEKTIRSSGLLEAMLSLRECRLGEVRVAVDLGEGNATVTWSLGMEDMTASRNPRASTRWDAIAAQIEAWPGVRRGRTVSVRDAAGRPILEPVSFAKVMSALDRAREGSRPDRLAVSYTTNGTSLKSNNLGPLVEDLVRTTSCWWPPKTAVVE